MSKLLQSFQLDTQNLAESGVDPDIVRVCHRYKLVKAVLRLATRAKLSKMDNEKLEELLKLLDD